MVGICLLLALGAARAQTTAVEKQRASVEQQRQSVRKQVASARHWTSPAPLKIDAPCEPLAESEIAPIVDGAAKAHEVSPKLLREVIEQESGVRPCAVSSKGAQGLMQLMPQTAGELGVVDPFNPKENVEGGARYLKELIGKYGGSLEKALAAYFAGPSRIGQQSSGSDPPEIRSYVTAILQKLGGSSAAQ